MIKMSYVKIVDIGYTCLSMSVLSGQQSCGLFVGEWPALSALFSSMIYSTDPGMIPIFHDTASYRST